jgi:hypothetical protein
LWQRDTSALHHIPSVYREFYRSLPLIEGTGVKKDGQKVIIGEDEKAANAEEIATAVLETDSKEISSLFVQRLCILLPKYLR